MPIRKPVDLHTRHATKAEKSERISSEDALTPGRDLPKSPPVRLKGHKVAAAAWRSIMREWNDIEARIVTRLDLDHLIDYCLLMEQASQFDEMRNAAYEIWLELSGEHAELKKQNKIEDAVMMAINVVGAFDAITKAQVRSERIRTMLKGWRESLYLTPRARAGAAPKAKEKEPELDPMEQLLGRVEEFVNGDGK